MIYRLDYETVLKPLLRVKVLNAKEKQEKASERFRFKLIIL